MGQTLISPAISNGALDMITREKLYELVWSTPMTKVAEQFGVSGSYMARVCYDLRIPRPEPGYWAKLAFGKAPTPQSLPEAQPGDQVVWSKDGDRDVRKLPKPAIFPKPKVPRAARLITGTHGLIRGAKAHFESGRQVEEGEYLKPYKKLLVDVTASKACLDKALAFANDLFNAFESASHRVVLAPPGEQLRRGEVEEHEQPKKRQRAHYYYSNLWSPYRPTVVYVGTVAVGLAIVEMSEAIILRYVNGKYIRDADYLPPKASRRYVDNTWTTTKDMPCGRLRLIAYSPYWSVSWSTRWQETKKASLTRELQTIVKAIENAAVELVEKLNEAQRQAEIARLIRLAEEEKRRQEEDRRCIQQSINDSQAQLRQIIQAWVDVMNVGRFLQGVQDHASDMPLDERNAVLDRLKLAREFIGTQNPLEYFLSWKTPLERYQPLSVRSAAGAKMKEDVNGDVGVVDELD
jgi:hypothetical protein